MVCHKGSLEGRLESHPQLKERLEEILNIVEAKVGELEQADTAEQRTIEELRRLGKEVVQEWARGKEEQKVRALERRSGSVKYQGKKS